MNASTPALPSVLCTDRHTCTQTCWLSRTLATYMLTIVIIGNIHANYRQHRQHACGHQNMCLQIPQRYTELAIKCKVMLSMMHYHCSSLDRGSGDLTWQTSLQFSTQASQQCMTMRQCGCQIMSGMSLAVCVPPYSQSAACRWILPMQSCSGNLLQKPCMMEERSYWGKCILMVHNVMHRARLHACCNGWTEAA